MSFAQKTVRMLKVKEREESHKYLDIVYIPVKTVTRIKRTELNLKSEHFKKAFRTIKRIPFTFKSCTSFE